MKVHDTRRILDCVKRALAESIRNDKPELVCQQGRALIIAMRDHIEALERERAQNQYIRDAA